MAASKESGYAYIGGLRTLCWPKEALFKLGCLRAFISLDTTITTEELLNNNKFRWPIETFFRGSGVAIVTPFNERGVDFKKLEDLIE